MLRCIKLLQHDGSWYMHISHTPLARRVKQAFLVVNSIELHLTAFNNCVAIGKWRLGACDTQEPPLLAPSYWMETAPNHEPPRQARGPPGQT